MGITLSDLTSLAMPLQAGTPGSGGTGCGNQMAVPNANGIRWENDLPKRCTCAVK